MGVMTEATQIVHVIDDDAALRKSLDMFLTMEGLRVRLYESPKEFLDTFAWDDGGCILSDLHMPGMTGIELLAKLKERRITEPVVMITGFAEVPLAIQAMKMGALDFIEKPFDNQMLLASLRAALATGKSRKAHEKEIRSAKEKLGRLSPREYQVFEGVVGGKSNQEIADEFRVNRRSVEKHRARIMTKLHASSLSELVRLALLASPRTSKE
jgi:two-component system, LuxR family, response regulator FixJ